MILNDLPTIRINALGVAIHIAYVCFFYLYTNTVKDKTQVWAQLGYGGALLAGLLAYAEYEDPKLLPFRYWIIITVFLTVLVGSPLLSLVSWQKWFDFVDYQFGYYFCIISTSPNSFIYLHLTFSFNPFRVNLSVSNQLKVCHSHLFYREQLSRSFGSCMDSLKVKLWQFTKMVSFSQWAQSNCPCLRFIHQHQPRKRQRNQRALLTERKIIEQREYSSS